MRPLVVLFLLLPFSACRRDEEIAVYREAKEEAPVPSAPGAAEAPSARPALRWTLPSGWRELPGSGMRAATLLPPGRAKLEATVIALPGDVGGELANVNRWRGQLGLPPVDEAALARGRASVSSAAGPVSVYEFDAKGTRLIAGVARVNGVSWFVKLMGEDRAATAAKPAFLELLRSLRAPDA